MKCYLINLDRAPERLQRMQEILTQHGIDFERFPAIDAQQFTPEILEKYRSQNPEGTPIPTGDLACGMTHREILRKIASGDDDYAVVMEDDLHFARDIAFFLNSSAWIPADADVVKLETTRQITTVGGKRIAVSPMRKLARLVDDHFGAGIYIISRDAARRAVSEFEAGTHIIDQYLFGAILDHQIVYQVYPAPAIQDCKFSGPGKMFIPSSITPYHDKKAKPKGLAKLYREIKRANGQVLSELWNVWRWMSKRQIRRKIAYRA